MTGFTVKNGTLFVDDVACHQIAEQAGTPCYIYSAKKISSQYRRLSEALVKNWTGSGSPLIAFACKANGNLAVMRLLGSLGAGADVVSGGEVRRALAAGIPASRIVFSGVGKTRAELSDALSLGIHQINIETAGELDTLIELAKETGVKAPVAFRYTPDVEADTHAKISTGENDHKFGLMEEEILDLYAGAHASGHIDAKGLSVHIGSQLFNLSPFEEAFNKTAALIGKLRSLGLPVSVADVGGGLGVPYRDDQAVFDVDGYAALVNRIFAPLNVSVMLEPGRFLVAESGALMTSVTYIKERPHKRFVIVDAGMNDLIRPTLYEAWHPILPLKDTPGAPAISDIVGPVCETGDYFALERPLPPVKPGDRIAVLVAGAYGSVMSSYYNARPFITEVMVNGSAWDIVRAPQKTEDIWKNETIPGWLK
jgi:diaminopimelate decarboxylase